MEVIEEGILFADEDWFYPVIKGIPRLLIDSFIDYEDFLRRNMPDYDQRRNNLKGKYNGLIQYTLKKNSRTKKSFEREWKLFDYEKDKVWDLERAGLLQRFLNETAETRESISGKLILDAGCGNGLLNQFIAESGATIVGMDLSLSIEKAHQLNKMAGAVFIQGDVQFPPLEFRSFDIVHCSGVLIHTNNSELSFSCIDPCLKEGGKMSVFLYHPRKDFIHNLFNFIRKYSSKLPLGLQYYLYAVTLLPISFVIKRVKGNKQNLREMMVAILDWFTPQFRWEHAHAESASWFSKRNYSSVRVTTIETFGYNVIGIKNTFR